MSFAASMFDVASEMMSCAVSTCCRALTSTQAYGLKLWLFGPAGPPPELTMLSERSDASNGEVVAADDDGEASYAPIARGVCCMLHDVRCSCIVCSCMLHAVRCMLCVAARHVACCTLHAGRWSCRRAAPSSAHELDACFDALAARATDGPAPTDDRRPPAQNACGSALGASGRMSGLRKVVAGAAEAREALELVQWIMQAASQVRRGGRNMQHAADDTQRTTYNIQRAGGGRRWCAGGPLGTALHCTRWGV